MPPRARSLPPIVLASALTLALVLGLAAAAAAQDQPTGRLGLSAAPDRHEPSLAVPVGEPFEVFLILTGVDATTPLPFALDAVSWVLNTECCGDSPVGVTEVTYADGLTADGDPYEEVVLAAGDCPAGDTVLLATLRFAWLLEGEEDFALSASALTAALGCEGQAHLLSSLFVVVDGQDPAPVAGRTWSGVKELYSGDGAGR
jgi:hypothetical protein